MKVHDLARALGAEVRGGAAQALERDVFRIAPIDDTEARPDAVTFLGDPRKRPALDTSGAGVVICSSGLATSLRADRIALVVENAHVAFARAAELLHPRKHPEPGIDPTARVHSSARLGAQVFIGPYVVVGKDVHVGDRSLLRAGVVVYDNVSIGEDCDLHSGVVIREDCVIGNRVMIHNNSVIGADGFGFAKDAQSGTYAKILQIGNVTIEDDVEIGALTAIDRASMGRTVVKRGTKIDNLVQIGHSVEVGEDSILCAQVGIAGSTRIGARATLAGQVGVADHVTLGDDVIASAQSGIHGEVASQARVSGTPAIDGRTWLRSSAAFKQFPDLVKRIRDLEAQVEALRVSDRADGSK